MDRRNFLKQASSYALLAAGTLAGVSDVFAGTSTMPGTQTDNIKNESKGEDMEPNSIRLTIKGGKTFTATLADNSSADALVELLSKGDITVEMEDYGNMEKVGPLGTSLPRNDRQTSTGPGDIILYQGKYLVIYYSTNSWNFTRIGKIDNADGPQLRSALGNGNVTVTLSLE